MFLTEEQQCLLEERYPDTYKEFKENKSLYVNNAEILQCMKDVPSAEMTADYISIGSYIGGLNTEDYENETAEKVGKEFCEMFFPQNLPRFILKNLRFDRCGLQLLQYFIKKNCAYTHNIKVYNMALTARCGVQIINDPDRSKLRNEQFYKGDLLEYCKNYVVIDGFESISNGSGKALLNKIINTVGDIPIVLQAGYLYIGDYECADKSQQLYYIPEELANMYGKLGFVDINGRIGCYNDSIVMIRCNKELLSVIIDQ